MKFKYTRRYPILLVLAAMPLLASHAQNVEQAPIQAVEEPPDQVVKEKLPDKTGNTEKNANALDREIEEARLGLDAAIRKAEAATGEDRASALAEVDEAEKQLGTVMEEAELTKEKDNRTGKNRQPVSKEVGKNRDKKPDSEKASRELKGRNKKVDGEIGEGERPDSTMKLEVEKTVEKAEPKVDENLGDKKDKVVAEAAQKPATSDVDDIERQMEPENEANPEEVVESKTEAKEAKEADQAVDRTTQQVEQEADRRKLNLKDEGEARKLIRDLIGSESEVSKAEAARETRLQPRSRGDSREARRSGNRDEIQIASDFLLQQLNGKATPEEAPAFFRRPSQTEHHSNQRSDRLQQRNSNAEFIEQAPPRYYHEGRRYVRFDSRNSVPAILLAAAALDRVRLQPASQTDNYFRSDQRRDYYANELPPENFRGDDAIVVSYPVSKSSMISSNDIIFAQGSTRFADDHSYDMVLALADAMANPALNGSRFVIEGHASAEGSYEANMALSQRRAEAIVRDMVREGIDPERLIPVGYGESEARYPADSSERLRSQDRNVRVFKTAGE